jgi:hypothetical protein
MKALMKAQPESRRWPRLLSEAAAAEYFSISRGSLIALGIDTVEIGSKTLYDRFSMDSWVARRLGHESDDTSLDPGAYDWRADQPGLRDEPVTDECSSVARSSSRLRKASLKP